MTDFGAFVELAPGVDALLHVSQISKIMLISHLMFFPSDRRSQQRLFDLNEAEKKISLSMKALESDSQGYADEETEA